MYILIGADLVPTKSNLDLFINGDSKALIGDGLKEIFDAAEYKVFNLEVPLTDNASPIVKQGPNLIAPSLAVKGLKELGIDLLTLANNHIMDQDVQGLESTIEILDKNGISHVGAGTNLQSASESFVFEFCGNEIGVYACAEHEFSIADEDKPGANPFDPFWSLDHVEDLKKKTDFVVVLYHGGKEHYQYPSPLLQKTCRRFIDKGADVVICQHSHCIGCEEKYRGGTIIYGQGNFIFDDSSAECCQASMIVKIDENLDVSYIPIEKEMNGVRLACNQHASEILNEYYMRSEDIKESKFIKKQYSLLSASFLNHYLYSFSGKKSAVFRIFNKLSHGMLLKIYISRTYNSYSKVKIWNYVECESHKEILVQALTDEYGNKRAKYLGRGKRQKY